MKILLMIVGAVVFVAIFLARVALWVACLATGLMLILAFVTQGHPGSAHAIEYAGICFTIALVLAVPFVLIAPAPSGRRGVRGPQRPSTRRSPGLWYWHH